MNCEGPDSDIVNEQTGLGLYCSHIAYRLLVAFCINRMSNVSELVC